MGDRGYSPNGKYLTSYRKKNNLYWLLYTHETFGERVTEIWEKTFRPAVAVLLGEQEAPQGGSLCSLDEYRERISDSVQMNYTRWGISRDATGSGSGGDFGTAFAYLKKWITERTAWMDREYTSAEQTGE